MHVGSSETFNLDLCPALPFTWMTSLLPGVMYFLHCPWEPTCPLPFPFVLRYHQFSRQPHWTALKSIPVPALLWKFWAMLGPQETIASYLIRQKASSGPIQHSSNSLSLSHQSACQTASHPLDFSGRRQAPVHQAPQLRKTRDKLPRWCPLSHAL